LGAGYNFASVFHRFYVLLSELRHDIIFSMADVIIIGGGIVGLATAYKILESKPGINLILLEKENGPARHQTGNNSGVIHSGIYYKPGSLKARNCIEGYHLLLGFCNDNEVPYEICGKIIVATKKEELPALGRLFNRGNENGLKNLRQLDPYQLKEYEPYVNGIAGIHVPQTGIIDYKVVSEKLVENIRKKGGNILFNEKVVGVTRTGKQVTVETEKNHYDTGLVVNCGGLYSDQLASLTVNRLDIRIIPFRGEYYRISESKKHMVKNLIYPVPDPEFPFLGVHFTRMIDGKVEAGPNAVLAYAREGYRKSDIKISELTGSLTWPGFRKIAGKYWKTGLGEMRRSYSKTAFTRALQRLIPEISVDDLVTGGTGVRAQACDRQGNLLDDFLILQNEISINVCNAPSPAATSSLSIGKTISEMVLNRM
jgi:(S)-2-hydroxyglutarate dehydrogenase